MRSLGIIGVIAVAVIAFAGLSAQATEVIALKSGETADVANVWWIANCRSLLKGSMTVEVLEGPPEVTASIKEQKIVPHNQNCAKPVDAGVLQITAAKDIKTRIQAKLVLRVKYPTVDGERQKGHDIDLTIVP